jgi:hypothetical protein
LQGKRLTLKEIHTLQDSDEVADAAVENLQLHIHFDDKIETLTDILHGTLASEPINRRDLNWIEGALISLRYLTPVTYLSQVSETADSDHESSNHDLESLQSISDMSMKEVDNESPSASDIDEDDAILQANPEQYELFSVSPTLIHKAVFLILTRLLLKR